MDAPPPVYSAGPENGVNGTNVGGTQEAYCSQIWNLTAPFLNADWIKRARDRRSPARDYETIARLS